MSDTIFALSSGRPPAALAIVRISGRDALAAARTLCGSLPAPRRAGLRTLRDADAAPIDRALVLAFPGSTSATGEDLVELHCHGGRAVVAAVEAALASLPGLRAAQPGEFTRRALENGRMDLLEAQGLADLLSAETEAQRRAAIGAADGRLSAAVGGWMTRLAELSSRVEAMIDFAEEEAVDDDPAGLRAITTGMDELRNEIAALTAGPPVDRLRDGIVVVLGGPPNSGKSTLLNLLTRREAAIVSDIAGTTRDRIEVDVVRAGLPYRLVDTAGLATASDDAIERIGIGRAEAAIAAADILLWLGDDRPPRVDAIWVHARADLPTRAVIPATCSLAVAQSDPRSIETLWHVIETRAAALLPRTDALALASAQQRACHAVLIELDPDAASDLVVVAEALRRSHGILARLIGVDATETMLDALFTRFCLGK